MPPDGLQNRLAAVSSAKAAEAAKEDPMKTARILIAFLATAVIVCVSAAAPRAAGGRDVVEGKCSTCHDLKRVCRGLDSKDEQNWKATIARMVEERGAKLSPQDQLAAYNYLIKQTSKTAPFCK